MKYTDNLKLHLPEGHDPVRREPLNANFNLLDAALQAMSKDLYTTLWEGGHRWRSYKWVPGTGQPIRASASVVGLAATGSPTFNVLYSDEIAIADDGTVSLVDPASGSYTATGYASEGVMPSLTSFPYPNKYVKIQPLQITAVITKGEWSEVAWAAEGAGADFSTSTGSDGSGASWTNAYASISGVYKVEPYEQLVALVSADSADAYPDDGWVDHIHYVKAAASTVLTPKLEIGSYVGTGLYGADNPTVLEFTIKPYVVVIQAEDRSLWGQPLGEGPGEGHSLNWVVLIRGTTRTASTDQSAGAGGTTVELATYLDVTWSDYGLSLCSKEGYDPRAKTQLNTEGVTYRYAVIGHME